MMDSTGFKCINRIFKGNGIRGYITLFLIISAFLLHAQTPGWKSPDARQYSYNANVVARLFINDVPSHHPNDTVAFFSGTTMRGLGVSVSLGVNNRLHFATVYSNLGEESLNIRVYSGAHNAVFQSLTTVTFRPYGIVGSVENPLQIRIYTDFDAPVAIATIPPIVLFQGSTFGPVNLAPYLISQDNDPIVWSANPLNAVNVVFNNQFMHLTPVPGFTGIFTLTVRVTEQTPNQKSATRTIILYILNALKPPVFQTIPGQGIAGGGQFFTFNLYDYEDNYNGNCLAFDYYPELLDLGVESERPDWVFNGFFHNNMTITSQIVFTDRFIYDHPDDIAAIFIDGEIRAVATPIQKNGKNYYYFTVGGGTQTKAMILKFYSGAAQKILTYPLSLTYKPYQIQGSFTTPFKFDFSPLRPVISSGGLVNIVIQDPAWRGQQLFHFTVRDCQNPNGGRDTTSAVFCIVDDPSTLPYYYRDRDGDGYGDPAQIYQVCSNPGPGFVANNLDCDDENPNSIQIGITFSFRDSSGIFNDGHVCSGDSLIITSKSKSFQYIWSNNSTSFQLFLAPTQSATYTITVTGNYGCTGSASVSITVEGTVVVHPGNDGPGTLRSVYECIQESGTIFYDQPVVAHSLLTAPLDIYKNVTVQGLSMNMRPEIRFDYGTAGSGSGSMTHALHLRPGKTLHLRNTDIKLINQSNKPVITGSGSLSAEGLVKVVEE